MSVKRDGDWPALAKAIDRDPRNAKAIAELRAWLMQLAVSLRFPSELDIDDLVQVACLRLLEHGSLSSIRYPNSYLRMMVRWAARDELRRAKRHRALLQLTELDPDPEPSPDELLEVSMAQEAVRALQRSLTDDERLLLNLRFWQGESIGSIAAALEISYSSAAVRIFRVLNKLRQKLPPRL